MNNHLFLWHSLGSELISHEIEYYYNTLYCYNFIRYHTGLIFSFLSKVVDKSFTSPYRYRPALIYLGRHRFIFTLYPYIARYHSSG
ncbi:hypothetical protein DSUL_50021 [Desulfovibrionales bacterium]